MDEVPMLLLPSIPTMVWGGNIRLIGRGLGLEIDEITEAGGRERIVIDHITRIHPSCAPDWPQPDEGIGDHRVIVDGDPQLTIVSRADVPGGTRADGGNTTAANRLLGAIDWLATQKPGIYDGLEVPLHPPLAAEVKAQRWAD
jgi:2,4-diaminopentanoate dehydrogenase